MVHAYAAMAQGQELKPFEYEAGELPADEVNIRVEYCGVCHSDLSMLDNDWQMTTYPIVPGHEVVGVIDQIGSSVTHLKVGDRVGLGWLCRSCLVCNQCMNGNHHRCQSVDGGSATIVGRHGGFADQVRCQAAWAIKLPASVDPATAGPMFCGGVTTITIREAAAEDTYFYGWRVRAGKAKYVHAESKEDLRKRDFQHLTPGLAETRK